MIDEDETGFGGFAVEVGASYSLYELLEVPASFSASYRFQKLTPGDFEEEVHQAIGGFFYHFVDAL